jgi:3-deoxy-7-phosphoheptulonate synthase
VSELLLAAEHVMSRGNMNVILCERGIRTFETATRNTLDVSAVPVLKAETHLPVIVDPSHAGGRAALVAPLALAAVAAGADGLIVEVHPNPAVAQSDGEQSLTLDGFTDLMHRLAPVARAVGRDASWTTSAIPPARAALPCSA